VATRQIVAVEEARWNGSVSARILKRRAIQPSRGAFAVRILVYTPKPNPASNDDENQAIPDFAFAHLMELKISFDAIARGARVAMNSAPSFLPDVGNMNVEQIGKRTSFSSNKCRKLRARDDFAAMHARNSNNCIFARGQFHRFFFQRNIRQRGINFDFADLNQVRRLVRAAADDGGAGVQRVHPDQMV